MTDRAIFYDAPGRSQMMITSTGAAITPNQELAAPPAGVITPSDPSLTKRLDHLSQRC
jgi:hypothetical protein